MRPKPLNEIFESESDDVVRALFKKRAEHFEHDHEYLIFCDVISRYRKNANDLIEEFIIESKVSEEKWLFHHFWYGSSYLKRQLKNCKNDINDPDSSGETPLYSSVSPPSSEFQGYFIKGCEYILDHGGNVNLGHVITSAVNPDMNKDGITALMKAATNGYGKIIQFLLKRGADKNMEDSKGMKAIDYARFCEKNEVVKILDDWGGGAKPNQKCSVENSIELNPNPETIEKDQEIDEFTQRFLDDPNTQEVLTWLKGGYSEDFRSLGELSTNEESIELAQQIYTAGAVEVLAVEIDKYPEGQNTGKLVIKLSDDSDARQGVFTWCGKIVEEQGYDPEEDSGQSHLFVMLD